MLNPQHQPRCAGATSLLVQARCVGWNPLPRIYCVVARTLPTSRHGLGQVQLPRQTSGAQQQPSLFFAPVCVPWPLPCVGGRAERPRQQRTKKWATLAEIHYSRGRGSGGDLPKPKKYPTLSAATPGVGAGGGRQLCVDEQFFGPGKRGKHSCVSSGSAISFENGACQSAKKQSWSITVIV